MSEIQKKNAPYAVAALVLGICSLVFGCFFVGFVCVQSPPRAIYRCRYA